MHQIVSKQIYADLCLPSYLVKIDEVSKGQISRS